jgi:two-component system, NtrC family, sensor histidine kinase HydH
MGPDRRWIPLVLLALPAVLLYSSLRTFRELDEQRDVFLRSRAAMLAARLENLPPDSDPNRLQDEEPGLVAVEVLSRPDEHPLLAPLWTGQELFRTSYVTVAGEPVFRAHVPFHTAAGLRIARIDLAARSADFLLLHARHNVLISMLAGLAVISLAIYAVWSARRHAELKHLAHLGTMSATLAHELRNPLGTIKGFAQLAAENASDSQRRLLEPVIGETERVEHLVRDLLLYGRPPTPVVRPTEWSEIEQAVSGHARQWIGQGPVRFVAGGGPKVVRTDPNLLEQVLLNLVRNAVEAVTGSGGQVRMEAAAAPRNGLRISVADDGPGFAPDALRHLFEPFFTTKATGTGLGLPISRKLVEALGGTLEIRAESPHGARAVIALPGANGGI